MCPQLPNGSRREGGGGEMRLGTLPETGTKKTVQHITCGLHMQPSPTVQRKPCKNMQSWQSNMQGCVYARHRWLVGQGPNARQRVVGMPILTFVPPGHLLRNVIYLQVFFATKAMLHFNVNLFGHFPSSSHNI